jgi:hypothetical protein
MKMVDTRQEAQMRRFGRCVIGIAWLIIAYGGIWWMIDTEMPPQVIVLSAGCLLLLTGLAIVDRSNT